MDEDLNQPCVTPDEDHLVCLIDYLRWPDARLKVDGDLWGMCWGKADPLNQKLADIIEAALIQSNSQSEAG